MSRLPVNASSSNTARRIAVDLAATKAPKGLIATVGELLDIESPARPFARVAASEQNVPLDRLSTYVFEMTVTREV